MSAGRPLRARLARVLAAWARRTAALAHWLEGGSPPHPGSGETARPGTPDQAQDWPGNAPAGAGGPPEHWLRVVRQHAPQLLTPVGLGPGTDGEVTRALAGGVAGPQPLAPRPGYGTGAPEPRVEAAPPGPRAGPGEGAGRAASRRLDPGARARQPAHAGGTAEPAPPRPAAERPAPPGRGAPAAGPRAVAVRRQRRAAPAAPAAPSHRPQAPRPPAGADAGGAPAARATPGEPPQRARIDRASSSGAGRHRRPPRATGGPAGVTAALAPAPSPAAADRPTAPPPRPAAAPGPPPGSRPATAAARADRPRANRPPAPGADPGDGPAPAPERDRPAGAVSAPGARAVPRAPACGAPAPLAPGRTGLVAAGRGAPSGSTPPPAARAPAPTTPVPAATPAPSPTLAWAGGDRPLEAAPTGRWPALPGERSAGPDPTTSGRWPTLPVAPDRARTGAHPGPAAARRARLEAERRGEPWSA